MRRIFATAICSIVGLPLMTQLAEGQDGLDFGDDSSASARDGRCDDPRFAGDGMAFTLLAERIFSDASDCRALYESGDIFLIADSSPSRGEWLRGELELGDVTWSAGEYVDSYDFDAKAGQTIVVDLRSSEFDPFLIVRVPNGEQFENDDFEGSRDRSLISLTAAETGRYSVHVTSFAGGDAGAYVLRIDVAETESNLGSIEYHGELERGDETLTTGEYVDSYEFVGSPGQHVEVELRGDDFDTYLVLIPPIGEQLENDDVDAISHSLIETNVSEAGTYRVLVTSYDEGVTGGYELSIRRSYPPSPGTQAGRDSTPLAVGDTVTGRLGPGDRELQEGGYSDVFAFYGQAGETIKAELYSDDFDTYLGLVTPADETIQNDDYEGDSERSVIEFTLPETGRYRLFATSYAAREHGTYSLTLSAVESAPLAHRSGKGRLFGIFAGISDYPGRDSDLDFTADDAVRLRDAFVRGAGLDLDDQYTMTDRQATRAELRRALRDIGRRAGPQDTFVFFFSGHGDRIERRQGPHSTDPDSLDETIELYDGSISDDELNELLNDIHAGTTLIFLDSCYSGGFAKDVISVPGRMGMFSSEEDVTSSVAAKFRAGGFLSVFVADGIADKLADSNGDREISAIELSQYVYDRYRADIKTGANEFARTSGPEVGHQHLVVDRGGIGPYEILFE